MKEPLIAISVLHYKNLDDTRECLRSLQRLTYKNVKIFVVNNDHFEHGEKLRTEFGNSINVIQPKTNTGFAEGHNIAIRHALQDPEVAGIVILNNDTVVVPKLIDELTAAARGNSVDNWQHGMVACSAMQYEDRSKVDNFGITLMASGLPFNRLTTEDKLFCPSASCALYTRQMLESTSLTVDGRVCYFDPAYFAYAEDLDLGWRARLAGFSCGFAPGAIIFHRGSAATSKLSDFAVYHTYRNLAWTQLKNFSWKLMLWQSPWLGLGWVFIFFFYLAKGRPASIIQALFDACLGARFIMRRRLQIRKLQRTSDRDMLALFQGGLFPKTFLKK